MRIIAITLLLSLACALTGAGGHFQYDRVAVDHGVVWRIATSAISHWSIDQLLWDGIAFALLGFVCARRWPARTRATLIASAIVIPLFIHLAMPAVWTYRGLSGVDSALFALAACRIAAEQRGWSRAMAAIAFAGFLAKIGFEMISGSTLFVRELAPGVMSLPDAHVIGAIIGVAIAWADPKTLTRPSATLSRKRERALATPILADSRLLAEFLAERSERTFELEDLFL
ncbi:MAG: rhombosortase [Thermoanaerobaculia bacterium]